MSQYAAKGMLVSVRGRLHYSKWTDKDGVERYGSEIIAEDVQFLSRGRPRGDDAQAQDEESLV